MSRFLGPDIISIKSVDIKNKIKNKNKLDVLELGFLLFTSIKIHSFTVSLS